MKHTIFIILALMLCGCTVSKRAAERENQRIAVMVTRAAYSPRPCIDTLGAAKYPRILDAVPLHFAIGGFAQTFGDFFPVAKLELERGRAFVRVNLLWSDAHKYGDSDKQAIAREAQRYEVLCKLYPGKVAIAPFTEHNIKDPDRFLAFTQQHAPSCRIVNSVWRGDLTRNAKYINEVHGNHARPNIPGVSFFYSHDGENSNDSNFTKDLNTFAGAEMFCAWNPRNNGKWSMNDITPRSARQGWASRDIIAAQTYLFTGKGITSVPQNWIIKPLSERHGASDAKGDKLLIIAPVKADTIVLKRKGQRIATLTYYGTYQGGGYRYYAQVMGWKLGAGLDIFMNGKKYGTINAGFRDGIFR